jgi:uncharacterized protein (DUF58 family)
LIVPVWLGPRAYWLLAGLTAIAGAGAVLTPLWWVALGGSGVLIAAVIADLLTGPRRGAVEIARMAPEPFSLRRGGTLQYRIRNASAAPIDAGILEGSPLLLQIDAGVARVRVPAHSEAIADLAVTPVARGAEELHEFYAWIENGIGLLRRRIRCAGASAVRVYPDLSAVERYGSLRARNRLIEAGLRRMRLRGAGSEPESVREWSDGDAFRSINWKATARRGKMMVAQYEVERSQNVMILLDAGRLMTTRVGDQRKFDYAVTAALSVAAIASLANDKVGIVAFAGAILRAFAPRPSGRSSAHVAEELYDLEPRFEESDYAAAFQFVRSGVRKRSLVIFFTDMVDPVAQSSVLAEIGTIARRHLAICVFMNDAAIDRALADPLDSPRSVYAAGVALELLAERRTAAATLARLGVGVIDVPARDLTTALIDRYLRVKQRGLL